MRPLSGPSEPHHPRRMGQSNGSHRLIVLRPGPARRSLDLQGQGSLAVFPLCFFCLSSSSPPLLSSGAHCCADTSQGPPHNAHKVYNFYLKRQCFCTVFSQPTGKSHKPKCTSPSREKKKNLPMGLGLKHNNKVTLHKKS